MVVIGVGPQPAAACQCAAADPVGQLGLGKASRSRRDDDGQAARLTFKSAAGWDDARSSFDPFCS